MLVIVGLKSVVMWLPIVVNKREVITGTGSRQWNSGSAVPCRNTLLLSKDSRDKTTGKDMTYSLRCEIKSLKQLHHFKFLEQ